MMSIKKKRDLLIRMPVSKFFSDMLMREGWDIGWRGKLKALVL